MHFALKNINKNMLMLAALGTPLGGCSNLPAAMPPSAQHISLPAETTGTIPPLNETAPLPPPPKSTKAAERYSIVVNGVLAQEILFALARDAKLNIEIHPGITGTVTMNLLNRTLPEILDAIARQVDMRYELNGSNLAIMPDSPFLKNYQIEYPNVARNAKNSINMSTSIAVIGKGQGTGGGSNGSNSSIDNISDNQFWATLTENIKDLLRETDKKLPEGSSETVTEQNNQQQITPQTGTTATDATGRNTRSAISTLPAQIQTQNTSRARRVTYREAAYVIANPETGIISVRATSRQHATIREFIDKVMNNARRQVLLEATIVEVTLSDQYQQGIDWSLLRTLGLSLTQVSPVGALTAMGTISYTNPGKPGSFSLSGSIKLLETFGKLHVLSSPKLSVLNNQTGLVKVVDESVYFTIEVTQGTYGANNTVLTLPTYTSTIHTVPVGFMMYVTPQIGGDTEVTLNLRPTITRILSYAKDPNPALINTITPALSVTNLIPQIQTREMESIMRVRNGDIAVLGGLMQDTRAGDTNQIPGLGSVPGLGQLFKARTDKNTKSELVVFLRPVILNQETQYDLVRQFKDPASTPEWQKTIQKTEVKP
ncbi:type II secretion system protein GspD [Gallionella capsiferriformans]|uniref:Type II and III secretion system protein n=1 Tax=Gallionella capsiferriformans (strain ES-2) TaxID=395494 RepID=D9SJC7_GALCS|nr:type II and III secretion system protein [Gallionella capsiferriformans]ADL56315.1 type II and III secretion system protein [Gallionella capsiferriformans ES-2]